MKTKLTDLTFLIPFRCDTIIRLENTVAVVSYLRRQFNTNIIVLESAPNKNGIVKKLLKDKIEYIHYEDHDEVFHRTMVSNIMARRAKTKFIALWDADVIVESHQILDSLVKLRNNEIDVAYPYDGCCYDMSDTLRNIYLKNPNFKILHRYKDWMDLKYGSDVKGGAVIIDAEKFNQSGMENEIFYGWGNEDYERFYRWENLGYRIYRSKGPLFHLSHPRDINGQYRSKYQQKATTGYVQRVRNSNKSEQLEDIEEMILKTSKFKFDVKKVSS